MYKKVSREEGKRFFLRTKGSIFLASKLRSVALRENSTRQSFYTLHSYSYFVDRHKGKRIFERILLSYRTSYPIYMKFISWESNKNRRYKSTNGSSLSRYRVLFTLLTSGRAANALRRRSFLIARAEEG